MGRCRNGWSFVASFAFFIFFLPWIGFGEPLAHEVFFHIVPVWKFFGLPRSTLFSFFFASNPLAPCVVGPRVSFPSDRFLVFRAPFLCLFYSPAILRSKHQMTDPLDMVFLYLKCSPTFSTLLAFLFSDSEVFWKIVVSVPFLHEVRADGLLLPDILYLLFLRFVSISILSPSSFRAGASLISGRVPDPLFPTIFPFAYCRSFPYVGEGGNENRSPFLPILPQRCGT